MKPSKDDILKYLASQKEDFREEYQVVKLALFGSYAMGDSHKESDIDVLIEFAPHTTNLLEKKEKIRSLIKARFNKDVDLCREKYIKPYFKSHILNSAVYV